MPSRSYGHANEHAPHTNCPRLIRRSRTNHAEDAHPVECSIRCLPFDLPAFWRRIPTPSPGEVRGICVKGPVAQRLEPPLSLDEDSSGGGRDKYLAVPLETPLPFPIPSIHLNTSPPSNYQKSIDFSATVTRNHFNHHHESLCLLFLPQLPLRLL